VIEVEDAQIAARELSEKHLDGLVIISGTFHLGHLALELAKVIKAPLLLWGLNELPYNGGKIRLNSVCGVNLNASNLYKSGTRTYHVTIGDSIDQDWIDAVRVIRALGEARVGIIGFRAHGFFNLGVYDPGLYSETGVLIDHYELQELFDTKIEQSAVDARKDKIKSLFDISGISPAQLDKLAELSEKLDAFMNRHRLSTLSIRCWPEFAAGFGIAPCAAMSMIQSEGKIISCEGDVEGALSMLAHRAVGAETPFLFDFSQVNFDDDFALFWHCGVAPCSLWDGKCVRSLDTYFAGGKGVTADFVLKTGKVSVLRIDSAGSEYRMFIQKAESIPMEKELRGTYFKARFAVPVRDVLNLVIENGIAHHASVVYGDYTRPFEILAKIKGWRLIQ
jgi:L-fucose isomerase-like protein